ncbi:SusD/RagB family nutrient-binding outer membrane lipoprotein, partial [Arthrospira platensis SPKY1]|nr:SusD/RagB family nutrient-binding outer membrane lipoprotein [Arthrospira platensis SPKY1]
EAEALFRSGGDANTPYAAGVAAHMTMVGADGTGYMAHPDFALTTGTALKKILREKYIAQLYNPEFWNDMKRHDFDPNLFEGFVNVNNDNYPLITERKGPSHRALYPTSE